MPKVRARRKVNTRSVITICDFSLASIPYRLAFMSDIKSRATGGSQDNPNRSCGISEFDSLNSDTTPSALGFSWVMTRGRLRQPWADRRKPVGLGGWKPMLLSQNLMTRSIIAECSGHETPRTANPLKLRATKYALIGIRIV